MGETTIAVNPSGSTLLHAWSKTVSAQTVYDEFTLPGEFPYASYSVQAGSISVATTADHVLQLMAGSTLNVRIRRITVMQSTLVTTAAFLPLIVLRLTTAGTGGTSITPSKFDNADAPAGATAMTLPTAKGTEGVELFRRQMALTQTLATSSSIVPAWEWIQLPNEKPLIIPAGTSNGICVKVGGGRAGAAVDVTVEFVETSFL